MKQSDELLADLQKGHQASELVQCVSKTLKLASSESASELHAVMTSACKMKKRDIAKFELGVGSACLVRSATEQKWLRATVVDIVSDADTNEEWLVVKYDGGSNKRKKIQRLCADLKTVPSQSSQQRLFEGFENEIERLFATG